MKTVLKKAVIIIEDDEVAFDHIKSIISDDFPNDKQKYNINDTFVDFRKILQDALSVKHSDPAEPEKSKKLLMKKLKSYYGKDEQPVYLIDFLLVEPYDNSINGIHFHKLIHQELYKDEKIPSFFITAAEGTNMSMVQDYCENEVKDRVICHFRSKPDEWDDVSFKRAIIEFIEKAQSRSQPEQEDESRDMENMYED